MKSFIKEVDTYLNIRNVLWILSILAPIFLNEFAVNEFIKFLDFQYLKALPFYALIGIISILWTLKSNVSARMIIFKWFLPVCIWISLYLPKEGNNVFFIIFIDFIFCGLILYSIFEVLKSDNNNPVIKQGLISDDPIEEEVKEYSFGRTEYARSIVSEIRKTVNKRAFNIAITGAWGSGKTSFLNLIKCEMEKEVDDQKSDKNENREKHEKIKFITVNYNPWDFKEDKIIGLDLLKTISHDLAQEKELQDQFKGLMFSLQNVDQSPWYKVIPYFLSGFSKEKSINEYRKEIGDTLRSQNKKLVIFLDDLDRLDGDEILEVFKTIRNSFDIANTFFVLGFDIDYVVEQIKDKVKGSENTDRAIEYLDKIFQMRLNMPSNVDFDFLAILEIETGIKIDDYIMIDCDKFFKIHYRDVIKVINGIKIFKAHSKDFDDFNSTGLVMLEILNLKYPKIYRHLAFELGYLIPKDYLPSYYQNYKYKYFDPALSDLKIGLQVEENLKRPLKHILYLILPKIYNSATFSLEYNKYFKFSLPESFISNREMKKALFEKNTGFFNDLIGTSKHFHLRLSLEGHLLNHKNGQDDNLDFVIQTLFNINASIIPSMEKLATSHNKFIDVFKSNLESPDIYLNISVSHFLGSLKQNQKIFFASIFWYLDEENLLKIIDEEIEAIRNEKEELIHLYVIIYKAILKCTDPNLNDRKKDLTITYKEKISNILKENLFEFSLNWIRPFVFSKSLNNNHTDFSFLSWLFTADELIGLLNINDERHAELIRWMNNEFIVEYKFYPIDYENVFGVKYSLYWYNNDNFN